MATLRSRPEGPPDASRRRFLLCAIAVAAVLVVLAGVLGTQAAGAVTLRLVSDSAFVVGAALAATSCARRGQRSTGRERRAWLLLAVTGAAWTIGNLFWFYYQNLAPSHPYPSLADVGYLIALVAATAALASFPPDRQRPGERLRLVLDGLVVLGAVFFTSWVLVLGHVVDASGGGLGGLIAAAYPLADVFLATLALLLVARAQDRVRLDLVLVALAFLVYAAADSAYAYQGSQGTFSVGTTLDPGWIGGYLLLALAAQAPRPDAGRTGSLASGRRLSGLTPVLIYVPMFVAVVVAALHDFRGHDDVIPYAVGVATLVLFGVRQVVLTADNATLRRDLEDRVADRTAQLQHVAQRSERILDSVAEGIYGVGTDGKITFVNPAAAATLGWDAAELLGRDAHELLHWTPSGDAHSAAPCHVEAALLEGEHLRSADEVYVRRDGSRLPVEVTASPQRVDGEVTGAVVAFQDITQRREVERLKEEFISVVSHELRTPLTSIRGSLGLVTGGAVGELPPAASRMVRIAYDSSERLTRLINDILDIERIGSGAIPMQIARSPVRPLITSTVETLRPVADAASVRIAVESDDAFVLADSDRVVQCLVNLIGNAVKFSPSGSTVAVAAHRTGDFVTFVVADQGRGIPDDQLETVFERFRQVDSSDAREKGGTGLGLAITRSIVERHGGSIVAESPAVGGAVFRFTLPAGPEERTPVPLPAPADDGRPRVLICDDDQDLLEVLEAMLESRGFAITAVARGEDAVARALVERPAVVMLDLRMPGMTGWETMAALERHPKTRDIPVLVLSVLPPSADPVLAQRAEGWLTKPVDPDALQAALARALSHPDTRPVVVVVEDDEDLAAVLVEIMERRGIHAVGAETKQQAVEACQRLLPDALVLDLRLADGTGEDVVRRLRGDGRLARVPVVVYSAGEVLGQSRDALRLGETVFLTKGRDTPEALMARVAALIERAQTFSARPAKGDARHAEALARR